MGWGVAYERGGIEHERRDRTMILSRLKRIGEASGWGKEREKTVAIYSMPKWNGRAMAARNWTLSGHNNY